MAYSWQPSLTDVATLIPERTITVTSPGSETTAGTFNGTTTPTDTQAQTFIDQASSYVALKVGTVNPALEPDAKLAAAMRAAGLIELAYPTRDDDLNTGDRWIKLADSAITAVASANTDPAAALRPSGQFPSYSFPPADDSIGYPRVTRTSTGF